MRYKTLFFSITALFMLFLHACITSAPKYSRVEQVMLLKPGMSYEEVNEVLGVKPYDLRRFDSTGQRVMVYKYRTTDRQALFLKDTNGHEIRGRFVDLHATFTPQDTLILMESFLSDSKALTKSIDINTLIIFFTVTAPTILLYLGIKNL